MTLFRWFLCKWRLISFFSMNGIPIQISPMLHPGFVHPLNPFAHFARLQSSKKQKNCVSFSTAAIYNHCNLIWCTHLKNNCTTVIRNYFSLYYVLTFGLLRKTPVPCLGRDSHETMFSYRWINLWLIVFLLLLNQPHHHPATPTTIAILRLRTAFLCYFSMFLDVLVLISCLVIRRCLSPIFQFVYNSTTHFPTNWVLQKCNSNLSQLLQASFSVAWLLPTGNEPDPEDTPRPKVCNR